jgi:hypothetical protein
MKSHHETHQTLFENVGKKERRNGNIVEWVNFLKVHYMHELSQQNP